MKKIRSLSIFFPFFNDEGTVRRQIHLAYNTGKSLAYILEVVALHGGKSKDKTFLLIKKMKEEHPDLKIINKLNNKEGYAVIKYGLKAASKEWVFYTDGDAQYHLEEDLPRLVQKQLETGADVINGYKTKRSDNFFRVIFGNIYAKVSKIIFQLPICDIDCDFRLIRKKYLDKIILESNNSSILLEMVKKLQFAGAKFAEIPVSHYSRTYGKSNYNILSLLKEKIIGDFKVFIKLIRFKNFT